MTVPDFPIHDCPGFAPVDESGNESEKPDDFDESYMRGRELSGIKADGYLRNWHLTKISEQILSDYRGDG